MSNFGNMRGIRIFQDLTENPIIDNPKEQRAGKNAALVEQRNLLLLTRFYWYSSVVKLRYDYILLQLCNEFFLAERRITDIISEDRNVIFGLRKSNPALEYFKQKYPYLNWTHSPKPTVSKC